MKEYFYNVMAYLIWEYNPILQEQGWLLGLFQ